MFPRWITWIFLIFLGYMLAQGQFITAPGESPVAPERSYPKLSAIADPERWKQGIDPAYVGPPRWRDVAEGEGEPAQCGQTLRVTITGIEGKFAKPQTITLGGAPLPALDTLLIGIKPGAKREITLPAAVLDPDKPGMATFTVERAPEQAKAAGSE
jgi:hypothetical protein